MENRLIFLFMAAIDEKRAKENRWLPDDLFPLVTHCIATAGRPDNGSKFAGGESKRDAGQSRSFAFGRMVGIIYIFQFEYGSHRFTPIWQYL